MAIETAAQRLGTPDTGNPLVRRLLALSDKAQRGGLTAEEASFFRAGCARLGIANARAVSAPAKPAPARPASPASPTPLPMRTMPAPMPAPAPAPAPAASAPPTPKYRYRETGWPDIPGMGRGDVLRAFDLLTVRLGVADQRPLLRWVRRAASWEPADHLDNRDLLGWQSGPSVFVRADQSPAEIWRTIAHELAHLSQQRGGFRGTAGDAEAAADETVERIMKEPAFAGLVN